ncbi:MAG TPA: hypothetical protein VFW19_08270 [Allosphingosinicella sp.]|nr:hypothetical protein [Allosphingosinicella sp.]
MSIWQRLGLERTGDVDAIRRAYARRLKAIDPESDPNSFIALRQALQSALAQARAARPEAPAEPFPAAEASEPAPAPEPPMPSVPSPDRPRLDEAPLRRVQALLFGDAADFDPEALEAETRALLGDPALEQVDVSRQMEALLIQWIVQGTPRSDAMIEPAIAFFRWEAAAAAFRRAPAIEWIMQRQGDRFFEGDLAAKGRRPYSRLLRSLQAPPAPMGRFARWRLAPYASVLVAYCRQRHPSLPRAFDPRTLEGWEEEFAALRTGKGIGARIARWRRKDVAARGVLRSERPPFAPRLWLGIILMPFIWAWLLLRPGHSWTGRFLGFAWLAIILIVVNGAPRDDSGRAGTRPPPAAWHLPYVAPQDDIDPLLAAIAPGRLTLEDLARRNRPLAARLIGMWHADRENGTNIDDFNRSAGLLLDASYRAALRGGGYGLQSAYWRVEADKLRFVQARGPSACDAFMGAGAHPAWSDALLERQADMRAKAIAAGPADPPEPAASPPGARPGFAVPALLFEAAAKRAGLGPKTMSAALTGGGTPAQRCTARIALIDEALAAPPSAAAPLLKSMSAGL